MNPAGSSDKIKKFLYKARGVALRGSIRKRFYQELGEHAVVSTHAAAPGRMQAQSANFAIPNYIQYKAASSELTADVKGNIPARQFRTRVTTEVEGLNVLNGRITADRVVGVLNSVFDERFYPGEPGPRISPFGSKFENLRIDNKPVEVTLPPPFTTDPTDYFNHKIPNIIEPSITAKPFHLEGLGTVYIAEWVWVHQDEKLQQVLVMLRLALGSDDGMDSDVCMCYSDGSGIDP